jgi:hypothetical protein
LAAKVEYREFLVQDAVEKAAKQKINVLLAQLTAEQSRLRFERNLT